MDGNGLAAFEFVKDFASDESGGFDSINPSKSYTRTVILRYISRRLQRALCTPFRMSDSSCDRESLRHIIQTHH